MKKQQAKLPYYDKSEGLFLPSNWSEFDALIQWIEETDRVISGARADLITTLSQVTAPSRSRERNEALAHKALLNGASRVSYNRIDWPIFGDCQNRFTQTFKCPPYLDPWGRKTKRDYAIYIDLHTRCRRCPKCLRHRAALWKARALAEYQGSVRTWFGTLTLRPDRQWHFRARAIQRASREGASFEAMSSDDQFKRVHAEISRELTKGIKRLRQNTQSPFKYLIVAERHKSGDPHYHLLIHERSASRPIRYAQLKSDLWREGFSNYRLVVADDNPAYLCKYLGKDMAARVRASQNYGCNTTQNRVIGKELSRETMTQKRTNFF